jgi:hypothetical protein
MSTIIRILIRYFYTRTCTASTGGVRWDLSNDLFRYNPYLPATVASYDGSSRAPFIF